MSTSAFLVRCVLVLICTLLFVWLTSNSRLALPEEKVSLTGKPPKVLLISYDGLRWDYLSHATVPNIRYLMERGVHASQGLKNTFITITAPNHYGIVTGLYEENHGIVANGFYDPILNKTFRYFQTGSRTDPRFFNKGLPIWVLNDAMGKGRKTGCVMWVGCDVSIQNHPLPLYHISWNNTMSVNPSWQNRVDSLVSWFKDPDAPINLGLLYIEEPDETGHAYGPHGAPTLEKVKEVDQLTGYLLWALQREGILDEMNIIMTADHGMADVPNVGGAINLANYLKPEWFTNYGAGPNWNLLPKEGHEEDILNALKDVAHIKVYTNDTVPEDYHYRNSPRILPIQIEADIHYVLTYSQGEVTEVDDGHGHMINLSSRSTSGMYGAHGYNNSRPEMHPFFVAYGPAFKKSYAIDTFENVDIFPLMGHILGIDNLPPNNGSLDRVKTLLADSQDFDFHDDGTLNDPDLLSQLAAVDVSCLGLFCSLVVLLCCLFLLRCAAAAGKRPVVEKGDEKLLIA